MHQFKIIIFLFVTISFNCSAENFTKIAIQHDEELNVVYKNAIEQLSEPQKVKLKNAQLLWIKYRDVLCDFEGELPNKGHWLESKMSNSNSLICVSRLSVTRTKELREYMRLIACTQKGYCSRGNTIFTGVKAGYRPYEVPGGFQEHKIGENRFIVEYHAGDSISGEEVQEFWNKRALELCPQGYDVLKSIPNKNDDGIILGRSLVSVYGMKINAIQCK